MFSPGHNFSFDSLESLDPVELVMALEKAFDIEIPDEDAEKIRSAQDAIEYIRRKKGDLN